MINSILLAMVTGTELRALKNVSHADPTQGAAIRQAADADVKTHLSPVMIALARRWLRR